jgi:hypothetical protein
MAVGSLRLEYYLEIDCLRQVYGTKRDGEASDAWYLHEYLAEIRQMRAAARLGLDPDCFPRKEKYFLLYALLQSMPVTRVTELGSSLLEIIDGLEATHALFGRERTPSEFPRYSFVGIEKSEFLADVAQLLHPNHDIRVMPSAESIYATFPDGCGGIIYDRIVSSLAFSDVESLVKFLKCFDAGILNLLTSRDETFVTNFFGGRFTYFSLQDLDRLMGPSLFHLFGFKAPKHADLRAAGRPVIEGFFFYGSDRHLEAFIQSCQEFGAIRRLFQEKCIAPKKISALL